MTGNTSFVGRAFQTEDGVIWFDEGLTDWHANATVRGDVERLHSDVVDVVFIAEDLRRWVGMAVIGTTVVGPFGQPLATTVRFKGVGPLAESGEAPPWDS